MNSCYKCGTETKNPKFCSRSCSVSFNNKESPKRKLTRKCSKSECEEVVYTYRHSLCEGHHFEKLDDNKKSYRDTAIGEYRDKLSVKGKHTSWMHSHIRRFARTWLKHLTEKPCARCGYDLHVELCHIKPVSSYPDTALLGEVNCEENVIQLCRNCHWELDNNHLDISEIRHH